MQQQFIEEIKKLSIPEPVALIETISKSVREDLEKNDDSTLGNHRVRERKMTASERLRGALKFENTPQTKEEVREIITDYLTEKYS